jgi:hypothetical protein
MKCKIVGLFVVAALTWSANAQEPAADVQEYLDAFNRDSPAEELIASYWHVPASIVTPDDVLVFSKARGVAEWLGRIQDDIRRDGWVRTDVIERGVCQLSDTNALFSMRFKRVFADGTETVSGGVYALIKTDRWRIAGLVFAGPDSLIACKE